MDLKNISYPNPVLGNKDDLAVGNLSIDVQYQISEETIRLDFANLITNNSYLDNLVNSGQALWHIRVQCARTYMRENFFSDKVNKSIKLDGRNYEGRVAVEIFLIANGTIEHFCPDGLHEDYAGVSFNVSQGDILAISSDYSFLVDKLYDPLKAPVGSIINVKEGVNEFGPFEVIYDDDIILVELSKKDYKEYQGVKDRIPEFIHSSIVLPVLTEAILKLKDDVGTTMWEARLDNIIKSKNLDLNAPLTTAQKILSSPVNRAFEAVNSMLDEEG